MTYVTKQDLIDRFGQAELIQLTDRTNRPATTVNDTTVTGHITDAESIIDGYLAKVYALPLATVPPALTKVAADLARYFLHGKAAEKDSPVTQAYRDAIRWLENVSKGLIVIEDAGAIPSQAGSGRIQVSAPDRVFTRDSMKGL